MSKDTEPKKPDPVASKAVQEEEEENGPSASNDDVQFDFPEIKYEFLDNTADVQIHAWGDSLEESFEQVRYAPTRVSFCRGMSNSSRTDGRCAVEYALTPDEVRSSSVLRRAALPLRQRI